MRIGQVATATDSTPHCSDVILNPIKYCPIRPICPPLHVGGNAVMVRHLVAVFWGGGYADEETLESPHRVQVIEPRTPRV